MTLVFQHISAEDVLKEDTFYDKYIPVHVGSVAGVSRSMSKLASTEEFIASIDY